MTICPSCCIPATTGLTITLIKQRNCKLTNLSILLNTYHPPLCCCVTNSSTSMQKSSSFGQLTNATYVASYILLHNYFDVRKKIACMQCNHQNVTFKFRYTYDATIQFSYEYPNKYTIL